MALYSFGVHMFGMTSNVQWVHARLENCFHRLLNCEHVICSVPAEQTYSEV